MFKKINKTAFPPEKSVLIWDGDCTFCKFWKTRWELKTHNVIDFAPYQDIAKRFKDIPLKEFKKASRLIEKDGQVYSGPDSAYRSIYHSGTTFWHQLYTNQKWFRTLSDHGYNHIAKNRSFYYKVTIALFGSNPKKIKHWWILYCIVILSVIIYF